jgi:hypothetical protein
MVGNITESPRHWNLNKQTDGSESVASQAFEPKAFDNCGRVCVKSTLRTIVGECDNDVDPEAPVRELQERRLEYSLGNVILRETD